MSEGNDGDGFGRTNGSADDDPFAELEALTEDGSTADPAELEDLFEPEETADLDEEALWESVLSEGDATAEAAGDGLTDRESAGADAVVKKHQYCKQCEFFSEPPETRCTNPGTEIVELVGVDQFRLENCPVVDRRQRAKQVFPDDD